MASRRRRLSMGAASAASRIVCLGRGAQGRALRIVLRCHHRGISRLSKASIRGPLRGVALLRCAGADVEANRGNPSANLVAAGCVAGASKSAALAARFRKDSASRDDRCRFGTDRYRAAARWRNQTCIQLRVGYPLRQCRHGLLTVPRQDALATKPRLPLPVPARASVNLGCSSLARSSSASRWWPLRSGKTGHGSR